MALTRPVCLASGLAPRKTGFNPKPLHLGFMLYKVEMGQVFSRTSVSPVISIPPNIVRYIKYKRLSWLGHVERMTYERVAKTIYKWKPYARRPRGRPRVRWEDDVRNDLRKMGVTNWNQRTQERK